MEELLTQLSGKKVAISCGTSNIVRGEVVSVQNGWAQVRDKEDKIAYVALDKIAIVWEVPENEGRAGFIS